MIHIHISHTSDLTHVEMKAARALLDAAFDDMTDDDWEHALGGMHALIWHADALVGHASVVQRRLIHGSVALRTGYVEAVAVDSRFRRRGYGAAMMAELERVIRAAYDLGALGASDDGLPFYLARGWQKWRGPTSTLSPAGVVRTPEEDGCVLVLPGSASLDLDGELICDWRLGAVW